MNSRIARFSLAILFALALGACSANPGANPPPAATGGAIEVAVSKTSTEGSDPKCISVNGEHVMLPNTFERVDVQEASPTDGQGPNTVDVTFTEAGSQAFYTLTEKAAQAGSTDRLLLKIGGELQAAVTVIEATDNGLIQINFSPELKSSEHPPLST